MTICGVEELSLRIVRAVRAPLSWGGDAAPDDAGWIRLRFKELIDTGVLAGAAAERARSEFAAARLIEVAERAKGGGT